MSAFIILSVISNQFIYRKIDLTNHYPFIILIHYITHFLYDLMNLWLIGIIGLDVLIIRGFIFSIIRINWIITKLIVLYHMPHHIYPKTIDTFIQPETHSVEHCLLNLRISPVKIGLF